MRIIGLSATVSNVEDFSKWIESVRGDTTLVVSEKRPVPLEQHVLVQADDHTEPELIDLYRRDKDGNQTDKLNAQLVSRLDQLDRKAAKRRGEQRPDRRKGGKGGKWNDHSRRPERHTPRRWAVIDELNFLGILPGIYFIFSRNGCDQPSNNASTPDSNSPPMTRCVASAVSSMRWSKANSVKRI